MIELDKTFENFVKYGFLIVIIFAILITLFMMFTIPITEYNNYKQCSNELGLKWEGWLGTNEFSFTTHSLNGKLICCIKEDYITSEGVLAHERCKE